MKKLIAILGLLIYFSVSAQDISITPLKNNVFYIGVDNPIYVSAGIYKPAQIVVKASRGEIFGGDGRYLTYRCVQPGPVSIIIYNKESLKEIAKFSFRVKYIPNPVAKLGKLSSGDIPYTTLKNQKYLVTELENFDYDARFNIDSFIVTVISKDASGFKEAKNISNKLGSAALALLGNTKKGDLVIFKNIYAQGPDGRSIQLSPLVFTITN